MNVLRFEQIKKRAMEYHNGTKDPLALVGIRDLQGLLDECVNELEQRFKPTPARTSGPRPVLFDQQGKPILPAPMVQQFEGERRNQYALDRHMAVMSLDPDQWRIFSLRWGLTPPPGGWENVEAIMNVVHAVRVATQSVPYMEKVISATHLTSKGLALPGGMKLINGELHGASTPEPR